MRPAQLGMAVPSWWRRPTPREQSLCFRTKSDALKVFSDYNLHVTEPWGGLLEKDSSGRNVVARASRDRMIAVLKEATGFDGSRLRALLRTVERSLKALEDEVGSVANWEDVDPRYIRSLIFKREGSGHE